MDAIWSSFPKLDQSTLSCDGVAGRLVSAALLQAPETLKRLIRSRAAVVDPLKE